MYIQTKKPKRPSVSIHQSIKSRVETFLILRNPPNHIFVSIHQSIKSRVETWFHFSSIILKKMVSIHQSIKSRVETKWHGWRRTKVSMSLSINPSNQGLKHFSQAVKPAYHARLYPSIHQIKGWNLTYWLAMLDSSSVSLSINPSNQGLKLIYSSRSQPGSL